MQSLESIRLNEYLPSIVLGITALIILVATLYYRNRQILFTLTNGNKVHNLNGRNIVYFLILMLILSAILMILIKFEYKYALFILSIDIVLSVVILSLVTALSAGIQDIYTLASLGGLVSGILGFGIWFLEKANKYNWRSGAVPVGIAIFLSIIYFSIIYMSWNDNPDKFGYYWPILTIITATIVCIMMIAIPILLLYKNKWNVRIREYLIPGLFVVSKVAISSLFSYGVLNHIE
jgi:hypothetical protein